VGGVLPAVLVIRLRYRFCSEIGERQGKEKLPSGIPAVVSGDEIGSLSFRAANIPVSRCATTTTWNYTKKVSSKMTL